MGSFQYVLLWPASGYQIGLGILLTVGLLVALLGMGRLLSWAGL